jgi:hypothetical protein
MGRGSGRDVASEEGPGESELDPASADANSSFQHAYETFHLSLANRETCSIWSCVEQMRVSVEGLKASQDPAVDVYAEMMQDCERKGGEAVVEVLRGLCREGREQLSSGYQEDEAEAQARHDTLVGVCYAVVGLGKGRSVATMWGGYLRAKLKATSDAAMKILSSSRALRRLNRGGSADVEADGLHGASAQDPHPHTTALASILGYTSKLLEAVKLSGLGADVEMTILEHLHEDCSEATVQVLTWLHEDCAIEWWRNQAEAALKKASKSPPPSSSGGLHSAPSPGASFDACGMDFLVDELAFVCQVVQCYLDFVMARGIVQDVHSSDLFTRLQLCLGAYISLEDAYCILSVAEAMRIVEPIEVQDGVRVSSMVEDAGFLLLKSLERSVSTHSEQAIMATVNRIADILDPAAPPPSFFGGLQMKVVAGGGNATTSPPRSTDSGFRAALALALEEAVDDGMPDADSQLGSMILLVNSAQAAVTAVQALRDGVLFRLEAENPLTQTLLEQMSATEKAYAGLRDHNMETLFEKLYPPIVGGCRNNWPAAGSSNYRYAANPDEYEAAAALDVSPWVTPVLEAVRGGPVGNVCLPGMLPQTFELLLNRIASRICQDVESLLMQDCGPGSITEWGALLLQREVRMLQGGLCALLDAASLSEPFERLNLVLLLLGLDRPSDVHMYDTRRDDIMSEVDIKRVLFLRIEFEPKSIKSLMFAK